MRFPGSERARFCWRFLALLGFFLWPWPGLAGFFSETSADVWNAFASLDLVGDSHIRFVPSHYEPQHPWWVLMTVTNVFTGQSLDVPVDTRTVAYIRIAVYVSLALAWPTWNTRRVAKAHAWGFVLLLCVMALTLAVPMLQVLGMVKVLRIGVLTQSILSIGILTMVTYPSMAFAIPALIWLLMMKLAGARKEAAFKDRTS